jgi:phosphate transport system ATP-binding protein
MTDGALPMNKIEAMNLDFFYGASQVLFSISLNVAANQITALIGPSGCGKSTFLRCLNRMNDTIAGTRSQGQILLDGKNILDPTMNVVELRKRVGMVFQRPNPFPQSVYDNVAFGPRVLGMKVNLDDGVEHSLRKAAVWDQVKDDLRGSALDLSLGEQQRVCIARVLAVQPEVILMDEPCSALDPITTLQIEELIQELKKEAKGTPLEKPFLLLRELHEIRNHTSVAAVLNRLYVATSGLVLFLLKPQGEQRVANLIKIGDVARALAERGTLSFRGFARWLAERQEEEAEEEEPPTLERGDEFVKLMTIHRAKGSEANNIFVVAPDLIAPCLTIWEWKRQQARNLAYVAATRAKFEPGRHQLRQHVQRGLHLRYQRHPHGGPY